MLEITDNNYYTPEVNRVYMSASSFKAFQKCEAAALAEYRGEWRRKSTPALLVGSYVDAFFSGELDKFKARHPELYKRDGTLKADYQRAQVIAERLARDELASMLLAGKHQITLTGQIGGVWYKGRLDSLLEEDQVEAICRKFPEVRRLVPFGGPMIVDLKCMQNFDWSWDEDLREKVSFVNYWGYDIQGAIYQKLDGRHAPFVIVGVTKEPEPNIAAMHVPDADLSLALADVEAYSKRYVAIKRGEIEPVGCGKCEYCRMTKKLDNIYHYMTIG